MLFLKLNTLSDKIISRDSLMSLLKSESNFSNDMLQKNKELVEHVEDLYSMLDNENVA